MKEAAESMISSFFFPVLLSMVAFFLLQFHAMVKKMSDKLTELLVESGKQDTRIANLEKRFDELEKAFKELNERLRK